MSFLQRIERAVAERQRGEKYGITRVQTNDLRELLHHFKRLDAEAYARHQEEMRTSRCQKSK